MSSRCRSCQAPILWARTINQKAIPLDAEPVSNGNIQLGLFGGEEVALVLSSADIAAAQLAEIPLYVSHFVTCTNGAAHRIA